MRSPHWLARGPTPETGGGVTGSAAFERSTFVARLSHPLDQFQIRAMDSLDEGASVLVAAPTGSGKTLVAEYAIAKAVAEGQRAFYTAPIKALSNQKYRDLCVIHGVEAVGLVTGDNAINPAAPIVVMTTEVLRNMIYTGSDRLESLAVVVLDEVHFLQDTYRGPVWEEVIIQLPMEVQLVCLSATVSNADEVAQWLSTVRGRTDVVVETNRPVELRHHYAYFDGASHQVHMHDTIVGGEPNRHLQRNMATAAASPGGSRGRNRSGGGRPRRRFAPLQRPEIVELLEHHHMLPAIVFIFSRAQCEDAVQSCARAGLVLTSLEEEQEIEDIVERHCRSLSADDRHALEYDNFLDNITGGIASHHAGMIPMFKEAVEECFVRGLVKVVFATETLAVGINMPARAVVIEKMTKYTGEHHSLLRASEFAQLTGRAGRRGLDDIGHAIAIWNPHVTFDQVVSLALSRSFRLSSAFRPTFNMAANIVRHHSRDGAMHLLNLSFAQFQADREVVTSEAQLERKRRELALIERAGSQDKRTQIDGAGDDSGDSRIADGIDDESSLASPVEVEIALRSLRPGDVVVFDASNIRGRGLVLATAGRRSGTRLTVVNPSRKLLDVTAKDLRTLPWKAGHVDLPTPYDPARTEFIREAVSRLTKARIDETVVARAIESGRSHKSGEVPASARHAKRLRREIEQLEHRSSTRKGSVAARFDDVVSVLDDLGYTDSWSLTDKGVLLAGIFHESDLLVAEAMSRGVFNGLSAPDLVAVMSCLVYEPRGFDAPAVRWPNDTVRQRAKRLDKLSLSLQDIERAHGLFAHRSPHGGLAWETSHWAQQKPLSKILDPDITPGDFVRCMRQLIDLLGQVGSATHDSALRSAAVEAISLIDRGVVAAAAMESI